MGNVNWSIKYVKYVTFLKKTAQVWGTPVSCYFQK